MTFILSLFLGMMGSLKVLTRRLSSKCTPVVMAIFVQVFMLGIPSLLGVAPNEVCTMVGEKVCVKWRFSLDCVGEPSSALLFE